jgi:hypothetical protein
MKPGSSPSGRIKNRGPVNYDLMTVARGTNFGGRSAEASAIKAGLSGEGFARDDNLIQA